MKLSIPHFSQHTDVKDPTWQKRSCGAMCVVMTLSHFGISATPEDIITEGENLGGLTSAGWKHDTLAMILRNRGVSCYREEYRSHSAGFANPVEPKMLRYGLEKCAMHLKNKFPVIVSVGREFKPEGSPHVVLLVGYEGTPENIKGFYIHDPDARESKKGEIFVDTETLLLSWRKFALFPGPRIA